MSSAAHNSPASQQQLSLGHFQGNRPALPNDARLRNDREENARLTQLEDLGSDNRARITTRQEEITRAVNLGSVLKTRLCNKPGSSASEIAARNKSALDSWSLFHKSADDGSYEKLGNINDGQSHRFNATQQLRQPHFEVTPKPRVVASRQERPLYQVPGIAKSRTQIDLPRGTPSKTPRETRSMANRVLLADPSTFMAVAQQGFASPQEKQQQSSPIAQRQATAPAVIASTKDLKNPIATVQKEDEQASAQTESIPEGKVVPDSSVEPGLMAGFDVKVYDFHGQSFVLATDFEFLKSIVEELVNAYEAEGKDGFMSKVGNLVGEQDIVAESTESQSKDISTSPTPAFDRSPSASSVARTDDMPAAKRISSRQQVATEQHLPTEEQAHTLQQLHIDQRHVFETSQTKGTGLTLLGEHNIRPRSQTNSTSSSLYESKWAPQTTQISQQELRDSALDPIDGGQVSQKDILRIDSPAAEVKDLTNKRDFEAYTDTKAFADMKKLQSMPLDERLILAMPSSANSRRDSVKSEKVSPIPTSSTGNSRKPVFVGLGASKWAQEPSSTGNNPASLGLSRFSLNSSTRNTASWVRSENQKPSALGRNMY